MSHIFGHLEHRRFTMSMLLLLPALVGPFLTLSHSETAHAQALPTLPIVATVPVGQHPTRLAVDPTTNRIYALTAIPFGVSVIDGHISTVIATILPSEQCCPSGIAVRPSTVPAPIDSRIYMTNGPVISVIDGNSHSFIPNVAVAATAVAVNPTTNRLYVGHVFITSVVVINALTNTREAEIPGVRGTLIAVNPTTDTIYALDHASQTLWVIRGADNAVIGSIASIFSPFAVNPNTNRIYAIGSNGLLVIDGATNQVSSVPVPGWSGRADIAVNPLTNRIYVTGDSGRTLFVFDGSTNSLVATATVGIVDDALGVAAHPETGRVYVANNRQSLVTVLQDVVPVPSDAIAPVTTASVDPTPNAAGWNTGAVTVTLSATDAAKGSGVQHISYSINGGAPITVTGANASVTVSAPGTHTISYQAKDKAGNIETPKPLSVKIDASASSTVAAASPAPNASGWNNADVAVTLNATDNAGGSGVAMISYTVTNGASTVGAGVMGASAAFTVSADGVNTITYYGVDVAGNTETAKTLTVRVDKAAPVATLTLSPTVLWPPNRLVTITPTLSMAPDASGPVSVSAPVVTSNEALNGSGDGNTASDWVVSGGTLQLRAERAGGGSGRIYTVTYTLTDKAGNTSQVSGTVAVPHNQ